MIIFVCNKTFRHQQNMSPSFSFANVDFCIKETDSTEAATGDVGLQLY